MARYFSPHLINEPPLLVLPSLAEKVGINHAILLQQMHYWLRGSKHEHDGHKWVYNSYADWQKQLPWMTVRGVRKVIGDLERDGYIVSGTFNRLAFDKTKWYRIDYAAVCGIEQTMCHEVSDDVSSGDTSEVAQSDTPIPETTQETNNKNISKARSGRQRSPNYTESFESFWVAYPSGYGNKKATFEQWKRINPDDALREEIMAGLERWKASRRWQEGYVKSAHIWLRDRWWEDEVPADKPGGTRKADSKGGMVWG